MWGGAEPGLESRGLSWARVRVGAVMISGALLEPEAGMCGGAGRGGARMGVRVSGARRLGCVCTSGARGGTEAGWLRL